MELFFDTETTGLPLFKEPATHPGQPDIIQLAAVLSDAEKIYARFSCIIDPTDFNENWTIHPKAAEAHGISEELVRTVGLKADPTLFFFLSMVARADVLVCHNTDFDKKLICAMLAKGEYSAANYNMIDQGNYYCTMKNGTALCKLPGRFGNYKWPKLQELHLFLFGEAFEDAHDALADVMATRRCYYELLKRGV